MKYNLKITAVLLGMFIIAQFIGLFVVNHYLPSENNLPFGLETPQPQNQSEYSQLFLFITFAFVIAIFIFFFLSKLRIEFILKAWFFFVVTIALTISFFSVLFHISYGFTAAFVLATILSFIKIYRRNFIVHNATELLIYPGIAAIFVPLLNVFTVIALLLLISVYDAWAVWHSKIMIKMAKYQMDNLKIFSGFFIPHTTKKIKAQIKKWKNSLSKKQLSKKKIKVNVAILGGGDVVFPIITSGVMLKSYGIMPALFVIVGATLGLSYLFFMAEKKKYYPAMPFITTGIIVGIVASYLVL